MPRTQIEKLWLGGAAVVALLIAVVGYFFLVSPQRARTQDVQNQTSSAQLQASTLQSRITSLTTEQKKAASYRAALAQARASLPTLGNLSATPALLKSLQAVAHDSSTSVSSLTVGDPTAITPVAAATPTTTATTSASASPSTTAAAGAPVTPAASLYSVAVTATVDGSTTGLTNFLTRLQHDQPRAVLISSVAITSGTTGQKGGGESMSLTMTAFVRPSTAVASSPAATVATPTSSDTP